MVVKLVDMKVDQMAVKMDKMKAALKVEKMVAKMVA
jgi:hypothetical protein